MLAYLSSVHDSTGFSPNMLMLGHELQLPIHTMVPTPSSDSRGNEDSIDDFLSELQETLQEAHDHARNHLRRSAQYQKKQYYYQASRGRQYDPGTLVWYYNQQRKKGVSPKLCGPWTGPYTMIQRINVIYKIQKNRSQPFVCHVGSLFSCQTGDKLAETVRHSSVSAFKWGVFDTWIMCGMSGRYGALNKVDAGKVESFLASWIWSSFYFIFHWLLYEVQLGGMQLPAVWVLNGSWWWSCEDFWAAARGILHSCRNRRACQTTRN